MSEQVKKGMTTKAKVVVVVLALLALVVAAIFSTISLRSSDPELRVNNTKVTLEIADTSEERAKGLCCRDSLPQNQGMLFVYSQPGDYTFWMKDTRIPLDMYWINSEKKIIHIEHSVQPDSYPKSYGPKEPSQYVLETNAGFAKANNIQVGDVVQFEN